MAKKQNYKRKKWSWEDFEYSPGKSQLKKLSALIPKVDSKNRDFDGSTTKKGEAHGPVNANGMSSAVGISSSPAPGAGYGNSSYGLLAYGEAIEMISKRFDVFLETLKSDESADFIKSVEDGYKIIYDTAGQDAKLIVLGFQPSFRQYLKFNVESLVSELNQFNGKCTIVFLGERSGFENVDIIKDWYRHIGITDGQIERFRFIEKTDSIINGSNPKMPRITNTDVPVDTISNLDDLMTLIGDWNEISLTGCSDAYLLTEFIYAMNKFDKQYEVDSRYTFNVPVI